MTKKPKRQPVSQKTRFEVFKRDKFTCQYCGAKAPEVVLHADHINPVANGGDSGIMNLVTACADCNGGKGARKLDDRSAVERQRAQIEELEARREQLQMMLEWRDAAQAEVIDTVDAISDRLGQRSGFEPNEAGRADLRRWLKRFTLKELLEALDESFDVYMRYDGDKPNQASWNTAFKKVPAIANLRRAAVDKPYVVKLAYIQGIVRRRLDDPYGRYMNALEDAHVNRGVDLDSLEKFAKDCTDWTNFCDLCLTYIRAHEVMEEQAEEQDIYGREPEPAIDDGFDDDGYDNDGCDD